MPAWRRRLVARSLAATAVVAALTVAACGTPATTSGSSPAGPGASSESTASRLPGNGAPKVPDPIRDTARWQSSPCDLLTGQQLSSRGFAPYRTTPTAIDGGPGCTYSELSIIEVRTTIFTGIPGGLTRLYDQRGDFTLFQPIDPLHGHPAVIADLDDQRKKGRCAVFTGLTDNLAYRTIVEADPKTRPGKNPCKFAADLTVLALHAMKEGSP